MVLRPFLDFSNIQSILYQGVSNLASELRGQTITASVKIRFWGFNFRRLLKMQEKLFI